LDVQGRITFLNDGGQRFLGHSAEEIVGRHCHGYDRAAHRSGGRDLAQLMEDICATPEGSGHVNETCAAAASGLWIA